MNNIWTQPNIYITYSKIDCNFIKICFLTQLASFTREKGQVESQGIYAISWDI